MYSLWSRKPHRNHNFCNSTFDCRHNLEYLPSRCKIIHHTVDRTSNDKKAPETLYQMACKKAPKACSCKIISDDDTNRPGRTHSMNQIILLRSAIRIRGKYQRSKRMAPSQNGMGQKRRKNQFCIDWMSCKLPRGLHSTITNTNHVTKTSTLQSPTYFICNQKILFIFLRRHCDNIRNSRQFQNLWVAILVVSILYRRTNALFTLRSGHLFNSTNECPNPTH